MLDGFFEATYNQNIDVDGVRLFRRLSDHVGMIPGQGETGRQHSRVVERMKSTPKRFEVLHN